MEQDRPDKQVPRSRFRRHHGSRGCSVTHGRSRRRNGTGKDDPTQTQLQLHHRASHQGSPGTRSALPRPHLCRENVADDGTCLTASSGGTNKIARMKLEPRAEQTAPWMFSCWCRTIISRQAPRKKTARLQPKTYNLRSCSESPRLRRDKKELF